MSISHPKDLLALPSAEAVIRAFDQALVAADSPADFLADAQLTLQAALDGAAEGPVTARRAEDISLLLLLGPRRFPFWVDEEIAPITPITGMHPHLSELWGALSTMRSAGPPEAWAATQDELRRGLRQRQDAGAPATAADAAARPLTPGERLAAVLMDTPLLREAVDMMATGARAAFLDTGPRDWRAGPRWYSARHQELIAEAGQSTAPRATTWYHTVHATVASLGATATPAEIETHVLAEAHTFLESVGQHLSDLQQQASYAILENSEIAMVVGDMPRRMRELNKATKLTGIGVAGLFAMARASTLEALVSQGTEKMSLDELGALFYPATPTEQATAERLAIARDCLPSDWTLLSPVTRRALLRDPATPDAEDVTLHHPGAAMLAAALDGEVFRDAYYLPGFRRPPSLPKPNPSEGPQARAALRAITRLARSEEIQTLLREDLLHAHLNATTTTAAEEVQCCLEHLRRLSALRRAGEPEVKAEDLRQKARASMDALRRAGFQP